MGDDRGKVRGLIEKATNSTAAEVDPRLLKAIKSIVRNSDSDLRLAALTLMDLMKRDHSQVRYLTLLIIDELFMRSKLFRSLVVENLDQLLSLSVGFRRNMPLPAPPAIASILRKKAIEFLEKWNCSFGIHYRQIRLGFDYLKNTLRLQFPEIQANAARARQERREREIRSKEILQKKFDMLTVNLPLLKQEIQSTIDEIAECLEIVRDEKANIAFGPLDDEDFVEYHSAELMQIRLDALKEGERIHETTENKVVFDALRELYKLLVTKYLVSVQEWISVLIRVELADNRVRDSYLKEFISIQNQLQSVKKKCIESGCSLVDTTKNEKDEEEDFWEEGKIESSNSPNKPNDNISVASTSRQATSEPRESCKLNEKCKKGETDSSSTRNKLLAEAPAVKWGSFLDNWGSNRDFMANQRGLELESHWGRVDPDATIPAEKIAQLNLAATLYEEEKPEIKPCHAPLRNGGLCQRKDLKVCPFHGPIIARDEKGNPIKKDASTSNSNISFDSNLVEQLAKQAVNNVRERDYEEARKRKSDKSSQKRAKLAKIREHNESVLRDAALASNSKSAFIGEDLEMVTGGRPSSSDKKDSLASMLRRKQTPKDRLARRLLNTRGKDGTVGNIISGEDATYREAFPNQW